MIELCRPSDSRLEHVDFECLFSSLSLRLLLRVFASLLLERRVIFTADKLRYCHLTPRSRSHLVSPLGWVMSLRYFSQFIEVHCLCRDWRKVNDAEETKSLKKNTKAISETMWGNQHPDRARNKGMPPWYDSRQGDNHFCLQTNHQPSNRGSRWCHHTHTGLLKLLPLVWHLVQHAGRSWRVVVGQVAQIAHLYRALRQIPCCRLYFLVETWPHQSIFK